MHDKMLFAEAVVDPAAWFAEDAMSAAFDLEPFLLLQPSGLANVSLDLAAPAAGAAAGPNASVECWNKSDVVVVGGEEAPGNDTGEIDEGNQFILPWWRQVIWTLLFAVMVVVATGGNVIVIWIVLAHKRMRTVTNYFLVNLSVADTIVSTLNVTFNYTYMLNSDWPFGTLYCKVSQFVAVLSICASVFTLMAISIDRYVAIMSPLRPRMGRRTTLCIAMGIWAVATALSMPMLLFFTTYVHNFPNGEYRVICYAEWPDGPSPESYQEYVYNVIFMLLTYFLPIGSMSYTYIRVGVELWGSQSIGECTQRQLENIKSKRRVVKMMIVVVSIFAICWLPFHVYFIVSSLFPQINNSSYIQEVFLAIYWLAMSNSMYNPIIYCWMNSRFRRGFKQFFSCCPCVNVRREMLSRREVVTSRYSCSGSPETQCRIMRNGSVHIPLHSMGAGESFSGRHRSVLYSAAMDGTGATRSTAAYHSAAVSSSGGGAGVRRTTAKWRGAGGSSSGAGEHHLLRPPSAHSPCPPSATNGGGRGDALATASS